MSFKQKISESFSRASAVYEEKAAMQKHIAEKLVDYAGAYIHEPILDVGCGTGFIAKYSAQIKNRKLNIIQSDIAIGMCKKSAQISPAVCADIEKLPFKNSQFSSIFCSSTIQWLDMNSALTEIHQILKKNGYFFFSTFGGSTLHELIYSYNEIGITPKTLQFLSDAQIKDNIKNNGFDLVSTFDEKILGTYPSARALMRSMMEIGAGTNLDEQKLSHNTLKNIDKIYKSKFGFKGNITATWEVYYYICKKSL